MWPFRNRSVDETITTEDLKSMFEVFHKGLFRAISKLATHSESCSDLAMLQVSSGRSLVHVHQDHSMI